MDQRPPMNQPPAATPSLLDELHEARMGADAHEIALLDAMARGLCPGRHLRHKAADVAAPRPLEVFT